MTTTDPSNSHSRATPRVVRDCTLDWVKIDTTVMRDPSLSPAAKSLYGILATFADRDTRVSTDDPDGFDVPTRRSLAYCMGKSVDTIDRLTAELEAYRLDGHPLLIVERRSDPRNPKLNLPSVYHLLDHEHWDARAAESAPSTTPTSSTSRTAIDDCGRCDPSGWATVDDGTPDGAVVRCPHDGSIPAEPDSEADPAAAADQAQLVLVSTFGLSVLSRCLTHPGQPRWS